MPYVDIADKITLDGVSTKCTTLDNKIGVTNNTGATVSSGTLMGKSNYIMSNIGNATDSGGTSSSGSLMAKSNRLISIIGNTTDSGGGDYFWQLNG